MQQVDVTRKQLIQFCTEYMLSPCTHIENPLKVKGPHIMLVAWLNNIICNPPDAPDLLGIAFGGWLAGRCEFMLMDEDACVKQFTDVLVALCNEVMDVKGTYYGKS